MTAELTLEKPVETGAEIAEENLVEQAPAVALKRDYTVAEFLALPDFDDGKEYELVRGELVEMPGPSIEHGEVIVNISHYLKEFLLANPTLGRANSDIAYTIDAEANTVRRPDVAFVVAARLENIDRRQGFPAAPDLAIEVISPTDIWFDIQAKVQEYREGGVQLIWLVDPASQSVFIYHPTDRKGQLANFEDELEGEDVIPGFRLAVSKLFE